MVINKNLVRFLLCAMQPRRNQVQSVNKIVRLVERKLRDEGKQINNLKDEIDKAIEMFCDLGLISVANNTVRVRWNTASNSSLSLSERRRTVPTEDNDELMDSDDNLQSDSKTGVKPESSKTPTKKSSENIIHDPPSTEIKIRRRKMRRRSKRGRSRSRRRRSRRKH